VSILWLHSFHAINRKHIFHSKLYGIAKNEGDTLIVTSGNFTGLGIADNVESSVYLKPEITNQINFRWEDVRNSILSQTWEIYNPSLLDLNNPVWRLLYDEYEGRQTLNESQEATLVITLSHADTARINASPGTNAARGTQYFWLSKNGYDFFPPLMIKNARGYKTTYSALINLHYVDLDIFEETRVTFEAENNYDFRLGTSRYRYTKIAQPGDLAAITRISEYNYQIRIFPQNTQQFRILSPYAITFIGHEGKRYGFISNEQFERNLNVKLPSSSIFKHMTQKSLE
jgi:hypothetical protein